MISAQKVRLLPRLFCKYMTKSLNNLHIWGTRAPSYRRVCFEPLPNCHEWASQPCVSDKFLEIRNANEVYESRRLLQTGNHGTNKTPKILSNTDFFAQTSSLHTSLFRNFPPTDKALILPGVLYNLSCHFTSTAALSDSINFHPLQLEIQHTSD